MHKKWKSKTGDQEKYEENNDSQKSIICNKKAQLMPRLARDSATVPLSGD